MDKLGIFSVKTRSLFAKLFAKDFLAEICCMSRDVSCIEGLGIPSHIQEECDWIFHRLEIADIYNPEFLNTVIISQIKLLPRSRNRVGVNPFCVSRSTHIVKMIVHSVATLARLAVEGRQTTHVSPVVIAQKQRDVIRNFHSVVIIILHLLV